jgi:MoaA/NifB/PqqE/SkfB family radical SAM enzyme
MDDWSLSTFVKKEELYKKLDAAREYTNEVTFSSLEPSLHPDILEIALYARDIGFQMIEMVTNGNRLSDMNFCTKLIQAGINTFSLSIHSHNTKIHDAIV